MSSNGLYWTLAWFSSHWCKLVAISISLRGGVNLRISVCLTSSWSIHICASLSLMPVFLCSAASNVFFPWKARWYWPLIVSLVSSAVLGSPTYIMLSSKLLTTWKSGLHSTENDIHHHLFCALWFHQLCSHDTYGCHWAQYENILLTAGGCLQRHHWGPKRTCTPGILQSHMQQ